MMQRSLGYMGLAQDYGSAHNVVKMRPNGAAPSGEYGGFWDYLTDKEYREDYKELREGGEATDGVKYSAKEARDIAEYRQEKREENEKAKAPASTQSSAQDPGYRDVTSRYADDNGKAYVYRQFANGDIIILQGKLPAGWVRGKPGPKDASWSAITNEIGEYPGGSAGDKISQSMSKAQAFFQMAGSAFQGSGLSTKPQDEVKEDNTLLYVGLGVGGVVVLGLLGLALTRGGN